jgi:hypothetical protein
MTTNLSRTPVRNKKQDAAKDASPIADAFRSVGQALGNSVAQMFEQPKRDTRSATSSVKDKPVISAALDTMSRPTVAPEILEHPEVGGGADPVLLAQQRLHDLEKRKQKRDQETTLARIALLELEEQRYQEEQLADRLKDDIESVTSLPPQVLEGFLSSKSTTPLSLNHSTSLGTLEKGKGAASVKNSGAPGVRPALKLTVKRKVRGGHPVERVPEIVDSNELQAQNALLRRQAADLERRLEAMEQAARLLQQRLLDDNVQRPPVATGKTTPSVSLARALRGDNDVGVEDRGGDNDDDHDDEYEDEEEDKDDYTVEEGLAPGSSKLLLLTKEQAAMQKNVAEMLNDFRLATSYGRSPTLAGVAQVLRGGRGLIRITATGAVIAQVNDNSQKKGPIERRVACLQGQDGTFHGGSAGLADGEFTVVLPLSLEEQDLQLREELTALQNTSGGSSLSATTRLARIASVRAFELLFRQYVVSKFGQYSPHAGSKRNSQWTDWLETQVARLIFWNVVMMEPEVDGQQSLSGLVDRFESVFNHTGNGKLSSNFGGKPNPTTQMVDVLAILAVSCLTCHSREGCEGVCLSCHNSGRCPFPVGFLSSADSPRGGDKVPDDHAFRTFCGDPAMVAQFQLANKSVANKMAAYRSQYPGRQITMKQATTAKVVPVARDAFLERFKVMQGVMGVSGLKGEFSIRPAPST